MNNIQGKKTGCCADHPARQRACCCRASPSSRRQFPARRSRKGHRGSARSSGRDQERSNLLARRWLTNPRSTRLCLFIYLEGVELNNEICCSLGAFQVLLCPMLPLIWDKTGMLSCRAHLSVEMWVGMDISGGSATHRPACNEHIYPKKPANSKKKKIPSPPLASLLISSAGISAHQA